MKKSLTTLALLCTTTFAAATPVTVSGFASHNEYVISGLGDIVAVWCAEKSQFLHFGQTIDYEIVDGLQAWSTEQYDAMTKILSLPKSATTQLDLWDILAGGAGSLGMIEVVPTVHIYQLHNATSQDLVFARRINEPEPLGFLLVGLALIGVSLRRST